MRIIKKLINKFKKKHYPKISEEDKQFLKQKAVETYEQTSVEYGRIKKKAIIAHYKMLLKMWKKSLLSREIKCAIITDACEIAKQRIINITIKNKKEIKK